jgi:hypothetical protein
VRGVRVRTQDQEQVPRATGADFFHPSRPQLKTFIGIAFKFINVDSLHNLVL